MPQEAHEPEPGTPPTEDADSHTRPHASLLIRAYQAGCFPMADPDTGEVGWYSPDPRAVLPFAAGDPLGAFHLKRSLAKRVRQGIYRVTRNRAFDKVIAGCAEPRPTEPETWISPGLMDAYRSLHAAGAAHSVEAWHEGALVGGIYGVALGGAFFGESMFSRRPYASQVCLAHLVDHLRQRGYTLFDVQFVNPHLVQFGVVEVRRDRYLELLAVAVARPVTWDIK